MPKACSALTDKFAMVHRNSGTAYQKVEVTRVTHSSDERGAEMRELFFETAQELLQTLNDEALKLEKDPADVEVVRSIRRIVHTLKGDAAACGFRELSERGARTGRCAGAWRSASSHGRLAEIAFAAADMFAAMLAAYPARAKLPSTAPLAQNDSRTFEQPKSAKNASQETRQQDRKSESKTKADSPRPSLPSGPNTKSWPSRMRCPRAATFTTSRRSIDPHCADADRCPANGAECAASSWRSSGEHVPRPNSADSAKRLELLLASEQDRQSN